MVSGGLLEVHAHELGIGVDEDRLSTGRGGVGRQQQHVGTEPADGKMCRIHRERVQVGQRAVLVPCIERRMRASRPVDRTVHGGGMRGRGTERECRDHASGHERDGSDGDVARQAVAFTVPARLTAADLVNVVVIASMSSCIFRFLSLWVHLGLSELQASNGACIPLLASNPDIHTVWDGPRSVSGIVVRSPLPAGEYRLSFAHSPRFAPRAIPSM